MFRKYDRVDGVAGLLRDALRERVRDGLRDQRLAAARRSVEQDALRRLQLVLEEQLRVEVRQLDRVLDRLDLVVEPTDVVVGDVGDLFEHELLDLGSREALDDEPRARVHEQVVARRAASRRRSAPASSHTRSSSARPDHEHAPLVLEQLLDHDDLAGDLEPAREHDVERLVERDLLAALEDVDVDLGVDRDRASCGRR